MHYPIFYALPAETENVIELYEYFNDTTGQYAYSVDPSLSLNGFIRQTEPLAWVWENPINVIFPVTDYLASE